MTGQSGTAGLPPKQDPETLVLRGRPRPAVRFRRRLIAGITGAVAAALVGLSWVALEPPSLHRVANLVDSDGPARDHAPDALANVPGTYGDVPRLGPPLPGDLGRPILEQQRSVGGTAPPPPDSAGAEAERARSAADAERERVAAARQAARSSGLIVQLGAGSAPVPAPAAGADSPQPGAPSASDTAATAPIGASQQSKLDFARPSEGDLEPHELRASPSPWTLSAGTVIPASLVTGLNSDLPGMVIAQVTQNVRDSATGRTTLVPQGARLIGRYDSSIAYGQRRALLVWDRILFPDGSSIRLDHLPAGDAAGHAGLRDRVDSHGWQLLKGIALSSLLGVGTQLSIGGSGSALVRAIRESAQQNAADAGQRITGRNLDVQPTITIRPGWPVTAILNKDLVLQPWRG